MKVLIVFLALCALALGGVLHFPEDRIIGGVGPIEENPYQISLRYNDIHFCGGIILNENTILTGAACVDGYGPEPLSVRVGATIHYKGEEFKLTEVIIHDNYMNGTIHNNDMAILKLATPMTFNDRVQPIALQPANTPVPEGTEAKVTGWGIWMEDVIITPDVLGAAIVKVVSNEQCVKSYENVDTITENMLCAGAPGLDACLGDDGGPLVSDGKLIGVVSFRHGCAKLDYPGVYANVSAMHEFITRNM